MGRDSSPSSLSSSRSSLSHISHVCARPRVNVRAIEEHRRCANGTPSGDRRPASLPKSIVRAALSSSCATFRAYRTCCTRARAAVVRPGAAQFVAGLRQRREKEKRRVLRRSSGRSCEEKRRDETRREGKEAGKKGKATRTGHARLSTRHLRVVRADNASRVREITEARENVRLSRWRSTMPFATVADVRRRSADGGPPGSLDRTAARRPGRGDPAARAGSPGLPNLNSKFCQSAPYRMQHVFAEGENEEEKETREDGDEVPRPPRPPPLTSSPSPTSDFLTAKNTVFDGGCAATISAAPAVLFRVREGFLLVDARKSFARSVLFFFSSPLLARKRSRAAKRSSGARALDSIEGVNADRDLASIRV